MGIWLIDDYWLMIVGGYEAFWFTLGITYSPTSFHGMAEAFEHCSIVVKSVSASTGVQANSPPCDGQSFRGVQWSTSRDIRVCPKTTRAAKMTARFCDLQLMVWECLGYLEMFGHQTHIPSKVGSIEERRSPTRHIAWSHKWPFQWDNII